VSSSVSLQPMLEARSVAIVGASTRKGSVGNQAVRQLISGGFQGSVFPIHPKHEQVEGIDCVGSIEEVGPVDLAVLAVANESLEEQTVAAIKSGAASVAIFASCEGLAADGRPLVERLREAAIESSIQVCGGKGMGFLNLERQLRICGFHQPLNLVPGGITFLTHSASLFSAMLHNHRNLRFNLAVSTGNELVTTMDQYLGYAAAQPSTSVVGLFLETIRNVGGMTEALHAAAERDIPIVALKVGRTERSQRAVATHSTALAGEYEAFAAFAAAQGMHLVESIDEMADTLEIFSTSRRAHPGGLASVHDSGGERSLLIDLADQAGVPLATLSSATRANLERVLDPGLEPENPVDAWGTGRGANDVLATTLSILATDPGVGVVAFSVDLTSEEDDEDEYGRIPIDLLASTEKPVVVLANLADAVDSGVARDLRSAGVPLLRGTETGLKAIRHLLDHRQQRERNEVNPGPPPKTLPRWRKRLTKARMLNETESFSLLADFGVPVTAHETTRNLSDTISAADRLGYPVVLKITGVAHKSEAGGVIVGIGGRAELIHAWEALSPLSEALVVQPMAPTGVELALGIVVDQQFGPVLVLAAGGVLIELIGDHVMALPPIDSQSAFGLLQKLKVSTLLWGHRGTAPADVDMVVQAIVGLSDLAVHVGDLIDSIDVNPLIAHANGCVAVDALIVSRSSHRIPVS
jgi:acyl-CoA synthetase (NDP forming)